MVTNHSATARILWDDMTADWSAVPDPATQTPGAASQMLLQVSKPASLVDTLYLREPGDTTAISVHDLYQGQIGDCFLISPIGEIALTNPAAIAKMIQSNANGTETVTLYIGANGRLPTYGTTQFRAVAVTVNNVFPSYGVDNGATQDVVGNQKEIWPQVLEKAVAALDGGYGAIADGGSPIIAMEELTGRPATYISPSSATLAALEKYVGAGDLVVFDTLSKSGLPDILVSNHAYMLEAVSPASGGTLTLGNPWGKDQPGALLVSQLSKAIAEIDLGTTHA